MPGVNFRVVCERVSMAEVLRLAGFVASWRQGAQQRGPCPVHRSRRPTSRSFSVHLGRGRYQCFACGARGNALELWAAVRGIGLHAAALELCQRLGIDVPWIRQW